LADGLGDGGRSSGVVAEVESTLLDVGARDVDLESRDAWDAVESRRQLAVFGRRLAVDVHEHRKIPARPLRRVIANERLGSWALESDRVEHSTRSFGDSGRRGALPRAQEDALRDHRPERA